MLETRVYRPGLLERVKFGDVGEEVPPSLQCTPHRFLPLIKDYLDLQIPLVRMHA